MKQLDMNRVELVACVVVETLHEEGFSAVESIPGLIQAVIDIAGENDQLLDEAADFLLDGGTNGA